jgi:hypothetical protein
MATLVFLGDLRILIANNGVALTSDVQDPSSPRRRKKPSNKGTTADFRTRCGPGEDKTAGNNSRPNLSDDDRLIVHYPI